MTLLLKSHDFPQTHSYMLLASKDKSTAINVGFVFDVQLGISKFKIATFVNEWDLSCNLEGC